MAKVQNLSDIQQEIAFTEFDFYKIYEDTFKNSELGRIKSLLPLRKLAVKFGLIERKKGKVIRENEAGSHSSLQRRG